MANPLQLGLVSYNKGAYITIEGKRADQFYIIRSGRVRIEKDLKIPEEDDETLLKPGDFFGVVSTMSNHDHIDNAVAVDDCTLITVRQDQYSMLIEKNTPVAMAMRVVTRSTVPSRSTSESRGRSPGLAARSSSREP